MVKPGKVCPAISVNSVAYTQQHWPPKSYVYDVVPTPFTSLHVSSIHRRPLADIPGHFTRFMEGGLDEQGPG